MTELALIFLAVFLMAFIMGLATKQGYHPHLSDSPV